MTKLITGYITTSEDIPWLLLSMESVQAISDKVIIILGDVNNNNNIKKLVKFINGNNKIKIIYNEYPGNNGAQYQTLLEEAQQVKETIPDNNVWLYVCDSDEIIDDNSHLLLEHIRVPQGKTCFNIRMNHVINNINLIDATHNGTPKYDPGWKHYVGMRLYKLKKGLYYIPKEHTSIIGFDVPEVGLINDVIVWHYGKAKHLLNLRDKFVMNLQRSNIHKPEFLWWWYSSNLFGNPGMYPTIKLESLTMHPSVVRRELLLDEVEKRIRKNVVVKE